MGWRGAHYKYQFCTQKSHSQPVLKKLVSLDSTTFFQGLVLLNRPRPTQRGPDSCLFGWHLLVKDPDHASGITSDQKKNVWNLLLRTNIFRRKTTLSIFFSKSRTRPFLHVFYLYFTFRNLQEGVSSLLTTVLQHCTPRSLPTAQGARGHSHGSQLRSSRVVSIFSAAIYELKSLLRPV